MAWTIHTGDALLILDSVETPIDAVICDPPYNSGGRTNTQRRSQSARDKYVSGDAQHQLPDFDGDNRDQRGYTHWLTLILAHTYRLARPGASALVFTDWAQLPATSDALQAAGWLWRGIIPWHKPISRPVRNGFRRECEYVLWGTRGEPYRHAPTVYLPGLLSASQPRGANRHHITQKPLAVMRHLVQIAPPDGLVLDPFTGSGTTGEACILEGRSFLGIEQSPAIADTARTRLTHAARQ
ncbi:DNA-methyltransferase [Streptomyces ipomoeae]|uniref:DNA-methyltransferase n=1 Tax=Streptomyces ipomoeae TaxID=103232 RepID=UPI0029A32825|nr:site-specific DNA-methyltransferase [Streptomyces ipomoeae]MDX2700574.1 site-specific DNA-methyltransferase [Streptomyces ipomoeae]MDX2845416.1 site-specific DNA-methyltransferase [Streptomyces ipomoeae]